jgi:hypothetical protein
MRYLLVLSLLLVAGCQAATAPTEKPDLRVNCIEDFEAGDTLPNQCRKRTADPIIGPRI